MNVLSVVGARPQFIKAFPVSAVLREEHEELLAHTGQHYDEEMSDVFFEELPIPEPDVNLGIGSATHAVQTARILTGLDELVAQCEPDVVLVYGDTNSTLAGALAGAKRDVIVAHVEAGLRSYNREMPEEVNRILTDHCSDLLFVPSKRAERTLEKEGLTDGVHVTGDVMYDSLVAVRDRARDCSTVLEDLGYTSDEYVLATVHRAANTDDRERLSRIIDGLAGAPRPVVFPAHPRTVDALRDAQLLEMMPDSIDVVDPVGYLDFVRLIDGANRVATDSGGVQKEAFYLDTPCITLREETEWVETVDAGWNVLAGVDPESIRSYLADDFDLSTKPQPYGDGTAAEAIVTTLITAVDSAQTGENVGEVPQ